MENHVNSERLEPFSENSRGLTLPLWSLGGQTPIPTDYTTFYIS